MRIKYFLKLLVVVIAIFILGIVFDTHSAYENVISSPQKMLNYKDTGIVMVDRNGEPFYFTNNAREDTYTKLENISPSFIDAVIAAEDKNFYVHQGISVQGIVRSLFLNMQSGSFSYGGSTITQQLVKNTVLSSEKKVSRKVREAILAFEVEQNFSKDQILEMYLNTIYYGDGAIGIAEASELYFSKKPIDLTLSESAYIAGMIKYPGLLSPFTGNKEIGEIAKEKVLQEMTALGFITSRQKDEATRANLKFTKGNIAVHDEAPHFALFVEEQLKEMYGKDVVYQGLRVKTTVDLKLQEFAQAMVKEHVDKNARNGISNGAVVVMHPATGEVLVLVGSRDWFDERNGRVNMALSPRQPGSSFKPLVYAIAIDEGLITSATTLMDKRKTYVLADCAGASDECNYKPKNYDNRYRGSVSVRRALANSLNIPAVEVMRRVGVSKVLLKAEEFGISSMEEKKHYGEGLSVVLGSAEVSPFEMASAYSAFANSGKRQSPVTILEIYDKYGNLIYEPERKSRSVVSAQAAFVINSILSDAVTRRESFGNLLSTPFKAAVKTGTTDNYRDAWTIGYTPDVVTAVWVGNNDGSYIKNLSGSLAAAPLWKDVMSKAVSSYESREFAIPQGIVYASYCDRTSSGSAKKDYFIEGTQPSGSCKRNNWQNSLARKMQFNKSIVNAGTNNLHGDVAEDDDTNGSSESEPARIEESQNSTN